MSTFAVHTQIEAANGSEAVHKLERMLVDKELKDIFRLSKVTPELPGIIVGYSERGMPIYTLAFRKSSEEGLNKADLCFEMMARCLFMIDYVDDDAFEEAVEKALKEGRLSRGDRLLYMQESTSMEDIAEIADLMESLEELNENNGMVEN